MHVKGGEVAGDGDIVLLDAEKGRVGAGGEVLEHDGRHGHAKGGIHGQQGGGQEAGAVSGGEEQGVFLNSVRLNYKNGLICGPAGILLI
ncbi:hypothetical protein GCM10023184_41170 [Flaviaesturariibacter amylovorans]|uniref:Uncharacterized protein n=1 Tax=Flaviaesturariibacter amylovorans TaxID=1084520 RepID=A0ABP8HPB8_9BACT